MANNSSTVKPAVAQTCSSALALPSASIQTVAAAQIPAATARVPVARRRAGRSRTARNPPTAVAVTMAVATTKQMVRANMTAAHNPESSASNEPATTPPPMMASSPPE